MPGKRTAKIVLDGDEFTIHAFKIKEIEELMAIFGGGDDGTTLSMKVLRLAMRRAEPSADFDDLEPTLDELGVASKVILELAGIPQNPPGPVATAGAA